MITPPIPDAITTPRRSPSISGEPASFQASRAATMANCSERSMRRISTRSITSLGSCATRPAKFTGMVLAHSSLKVRMPLLPARSALHVVATSPPSGVVAPSPVTTTRLLDICATYRRAKRERELGRGANDEVNRIADCGKFSNFLIWNLHTKTLFSGHNNFNHAE